MKFIGTRKIRRTVYRPRSDSGDRTYHATYLYIDSSWGFKPGDLVVLTMRPAEDYVREFKTVRKLSKAGNGLRLTVPKGWDFLPDEWVVYSVELKEERNVQDNPGRALEEEIEGLDE